MSFYNYASSILLLAIEEKPQAEIYFRYLTQKHLNHVSKLYELSLTVYSLHSLD